jgi:hypothetical protein
LFVKPAIPAQRFKICHMILSCRHHEIVES